MRSIPSLRSFPYVAFETVPMFVLLTMALSRPFSSVQGIPSSEALFPRLSPPGDRWCDALCFVPAGNISISSTFQIFRKASRLWYGCFSRKSVCSASSFHSGMYIYISTAVDEVLVDVELWHRPVCAPIPLFVTSLWNHEEDGMCSLTVTSWGSPGESIYL